MTRPSLQRRRLSSLLLLPSLVLAAAQAGDDRPRPLNETDLLRLVEMQIDERAIIERIEKSGLATEVDGLVLGRLKQAGASVELVAGVRRACGSVEADSERDSIMLSADAVTSLRRDNSASRVAVNGEDFGTFDTSRRVSIGRFLKRGWNRITVTTRLLPDAQHRPSMVFAIGPTRCDRGDGEQTIKPVLWGITNGQGRDATGKTPTRDLGGDDRDVQVTYDLYYAGCALDEAEVRDGDYILSGRPLEFHPFPQAVTTVEVNGTTLNSFCLARRQVVITPLLRKGANCIVVTTRALKNVTDGSDYDFYVIGPMGCDRLDRKFKGPVLCAFEGLVGWERDGETGQMVRADGSREETLTREFTINLEAEPKLDE